MRDAYRLLRFVVLLATCGSLTACSDDRMAEELSTDQGYVLSLSASKDASAQTTRALTLSGSTLNAIWDEADRVAVWPEDWSAVLGEMTPQTTGDAATRLKASLAKEVAKGDLLHLVFPRSTWDYTGQDGTLATIAAQYDYALADVTVADVYGTSVRASDALFTNQQAVVCFSLQDKNGSPLSASSLKVSAAGGKLVQSRHLDGSSPVYGDLTLTPASAASVLHAAIRNDQTTPDTYTLTATIGTDSYRCTQSGVSFANGRYYTVTVKMSAGKVYPIPMDDVTEAYIGSVIATDGKIYANVADASAAGTTAQAMVAYVGTASDCSHGLAVALANASDGLIYEDAVDEVAYWAAGHTVAGGTWRLPTVSDWMYMFQGCGGDAYTPTLTNEMAYSCGDIQTLLTAAGGTDMDTNLYWTSSEVTGTYLVWRYHFDKNQFWEGAKNRSWYVRFCLAF